MLTGQNPWCRRGAPGQEERRIRSRIMQLVMIMALLGISAIGSAAPHGVVRAAPVVPGVHAPQAAAPHLGLPIEGNRVDRRAAAGVVPQPGASSASEALVRGWSSAEADSTTSVAWGDVDNDGDLDLAVGNYAMPNRLYRNEGGSLSESAVWSSADADETTSVAWGDVDNDGDLDLAVGNAFAPSRLYRNESGSLSESAVWSSADADETTSVAWGDVDNDGDLDLAVGNYGMPSRLYRNEGGSLSESAAWSSAETSNTVSVAWGDVDNDGDLDLAVGNYARLSRLYRNESGSLSENAVWSSAEGANGTTSLAWGDVDNDGDLDLAVGDTWVPSQLYRNEGGSLSESAIWSSAETSNTVSVAWEDVDNDGDLDLAIVNWGAPSRLYRNEGGSLSENAVWSFAEAVNTRSVAWGDVDNDGDLDLAIGNGGVPPQLYRNEGGSLSESTPCSPCGVESAAWGDVDNDGDLDLAVASPELYRNEGGSLSENAIWSPPDAQADETHSLAWGDVDNDGDLDLALGNWEAPSRLYRNEGGSLSESAVWSSTEEFNGTFSVAWGDVDNDGDLDLAVGNWNTSNQLYRNEGGSLSESAVWSSAEANFTQSVAWGDVDNDGDLDLAVGNWGTSNRLYRNEGGSLSESAVWSSAEADETKSVAWGDVDNDGDLDLAVGNVEAPSRLYRNEGGSLSESAVWSSAEANYTYSVAWGDVDNDGDLDLAVGNDGTPSLLYRNEGGSLSESAVWSSADTDGTFSVAWGDVDNDGDLDLAVGGRLYHNMYVGHRTPGSNPSVHLVQPGNTRAPLYSTAAIWSRPTLPITYTLTHPQSLPVRQIIAQYSLDGGGQWHPAVAASGTETTNLQTAPAGAVHTYTWDVFASELLGQGDNVVVRLIAIPSVSSPPGQIPGPYMYGASASSSLPFRLRASQVRVLSDGQPMPGALVYRLPAGQDDGGLSIGRTGQPWLTTSQGYLPGWNELRTGDQLIALAPISATTTYTLYATSAPPTPDGLAFHQVTAPGIQTLAVSPDYPLMLFNLRVALEWDARKDTDFLTRLQGDLRRASAHLYDWSNGQVALGTISIFHDKEQWNDADIRIYATNYLRPNAVQGGWGSTVMTDPLIPALDYAPGQVHMGVVWNRSGTPGVSLGEDWARTLTHELGHYLLYLDDNYLGLDAQGAITPLDTCLGAMSDPYSPDESEFHPNQGWLPACAQTLSNRSTGRSDWATIHTFYPWLVAPNEAITTVNPGPDHLPLAVTQIRVIEPSTPPTTLAVPLFYPKAAGRSVQLNATARAVLFQDRRPSPGVPGAWTPNATHSPDRLIDLGRPTQDVVKAQGARLGDRLCIYDQPAGLLGCTTIRATSDRVALASMVDWQPHLTLTPITSDTLTLRVDNLPAGLSLRARLFPSDLPDPLLQPTAADPPTIGLTAHDGGYSGTFADLVEPVFEGHIQLWVDEAETVERPRRETITDFALGGNPGRIKTGSGRIKRNGGGRIKTGSTPLLSADGQAALLGEDLDFSAGTLFTLQPLTAAPALPPWTTPLGPAYQLTAAVEVTVLRQTVINLTYAPSQVPRGAEDQIQMYYWEPTQPAPAWRVVPPSRDPAHRTVSAPTQGSGIYTLVVGTATPQIDTLTPRMATTGVSTTLMIYGNAFLAPAQVTLLHATSVYTLPVRAMDTHTITATIPASIPAGTYQLQVINGDASRTIAPMEVALVEPSDACFADRFTSGSSQWTRTGEWDITQLPNENMVMTDSPQGSYDQANTTADRLVTSITSRPFDLTACPHPVLHFQHDYVFASVGDSQDVGRVELSSNGGNTWTALVTYSGQRSAQHTYGSGFTAAGTSEWATVDWQAVQIDLRPYSGTVQLRFSVDVDRTFAEKGWVIDDVIVVTGSIPPDVPNQVYLPLIVAASTHPPTSTPTSTALPPTTTPTSTAHPRRVDSVLYPISNLQKTGTIPAAAPSSG